MSKPWPAYYDGNCGNCGERFKKGDSVQWGDSGSIVEEHCSPDNLNAMLAVDRKVYREQMCMKCFTVHGAGQEACQ
jgi:hypothetical protein